ncbi:unnamed protein product, partial [Rotaria sordida]
NSDSDLLTDTETSIHNQSSYNSSFGSNLNQHLHFSSNQYSTYLTNAPSPTPTRTSPRA